MPGSRSLYHSGVCGPKSRGVRTPETRRAAPVVHSRVRILLALLLAADAPGAVPPQPVPSPSPIPTTAAPQVSPAPQAPQAPAPPAAVLLRSAVAVEPEARVPLAPGSEAVVDPRASFELELSARSPDARLALVDAREDVVPATGTRELGTGTKLTVVPAAPLVPGARYGLRLDGAMERDLHDAAGRAYAPITLPILVAGTPPPPEPKPKKTKRARRSRP